MKKTGGALLAIDIGNTTVGLGFYPDRMNTRSLLTRKISVIPNTSEGRLRKEITGLLADASVGGLDKLLSCGKIAVIISSVVPELNRKVVNAVKQFCAKPLFADHQSSGLKFGIPNPEKTGADRLVNALAGFSINRKPTAIIDFGTATTISIIGKQKKFLGGAIMPGMDLMAAALVSGTSKLPVIDISRPDEALGNDTISAMLSGIVLGTAGAALKIISSIEEETGLELCLVITGGRAGIVSPFIERAHSVVPDLIFEGLRLINVTTQDS
jgi:type III pantothenate kinase